MDDRELLQRAEEELARRLRDNPIEYAYKPHQFQLEAHKDDHDTLIILGGNRSGKSHFAMIEALLTVTGHNKFKAHRWLKHGMSPVVWYLMPSIPTFKRAIKPKFDELYPRSMLVDWNETDKHAIFRTLQGLEGHLWFVSAEMRQIRLQGASVDLVIMDESPDEDVSKECRARIKDRNGRMIYVFSPIDAKSFWVRDKLYTPWRLGERPDIHTIHMPLCDPEGKPLVPHMSREQIRKMEQDYPDPADRQARIYGEFVTRSGLVFHTFDSATHLCDEFPIPDNWPGFWSVDPQYHRFAALQAFVDEQGFYTWSDELFSQDEPLRHRAQVLWELSNLRRPKGIQRTIPVYVDSSNPQDIAELNWHFRRIRAKLGAIPIPMKKQIQLMTLRVQSLLEPDADRPYPAYIPGMKGVYGAPRMFFFNTMRSTWAKDGVKQTSSRLFWEMSHLSWDSSAKPDKKSADGADACDCLIYGSSILAKGREYEDPWAWAEGMTDADIVIRLAEKRMDTMKRLAGQEGPY